MNDQDLLWDLLKMNDEDLLYVYNHDLLKINDWNFPWDLLCMCVIKIYWRWMIKIFHKMNDQDLLWDLLFVDDENYYEMKYL
jgi:hypothetical protein